MNGVVHGLSWVKKILGGVKKKSARYVRKMLG